MGFVGVPGPVGRYMSGLCVATLGLGAAGWLALAPVAFGYRSSRVREQYAQAGAAQERGGAGVESVIRDL